MFMFKFTYKEMISKGNKEPEKLPPTNQAAFFHGLCPFTGKNVGKVETYM